LLLSHVKNPIYHSRKSSRVEVGSLYILKLTQRSVLQQGKPKDLGKPIELQIVWANCKEQYFM